MMTWRQPEHANRTDGYIWTGSVGGRDRAWIYSLGAPGGPVRIEARLGDLSLTFPRCPEGLAAAKSWCARAVADA